MNACRYVALTVLLAAGLAAAQDEPTSRPTTEPVSLEQAKIEQVLADQEAAGEKLQTLSAKMTYLTEDAFGDEIKRTGTFAFRKPNQFRINVEFKIVGKHTFLDGHSYIFNGRSLYVLDPNSKPPSLNEYRLPEPKDGEPPADALRLGKSPFPMPFGQKTEDIKKQFDVKLVPPTEEEAKAGQTHLRLTPKPGSQMAGKWQWLDLWFDGELKLPVRLQYLDKGDTKTTAEFPKADMKVDDPEVKPEQFAEPKVDPTTWEINRQPL